MPDTKTGMPRIRPKRTVTSNDSVRVAFYRQIEDFHQSIRRELQFAANTAELRPAQAEIIRYLLRAGPCTLPAIARYIGITRQACRETVNNLMHTGWLERCANPAHKRSALIALTLFGETHSRDKLELGASWTNPASSISDDDLTQLTRLLRKLNEATCRVYDSTTGGQQG